jgi:hypothetical protein
MQKSTGLPEGRRENSLKQNTKPSTDIAALFGYICVPLHKRGRVEIISTTLHSLSQPPFTQD